MKLPPIVRIEWWDAQHPAGEWVDVDKLAGPLPSIWSVGFLVHEDRHKIVLASSYDGPHVSGEMTIPVRMIRKRRVMR